MNVDKKKNRTALPRVALLCLPAPGPHGHGLRVDPQRVAEVPKDQTPAARHIEAAPQTPSVITRWVIFFPSE